MSTQSVRIPTADGNLEASLSLAEPSDDPGGPRPGVIVLHELFGLNNDIRRIAQRFADNGYVALAPDLYSIRPWPKPICIWQTMNDLRKGAGQAFDLIEASREWLTHRDDVDASRMAVAGFCLGGGFAMLYAARAPLDVAAVFYGRAPRSARRLEGICPVFGAFGERDAIAPGQGERLRGHLEELNVEHEVIVYPEAGHSFMSRYEGFQGFMVEHSRRTVGYHQESAEAAWTTMLDFFDTHLDGTTRPIRS